MIKQKTKNGIAGAYVAPVCDVLEFNPQGFICESTFEAQMALELSRADYGMEITDL